MSSDYLIKARVHEDRWDTIVEALTTIANALVDLRNWKQEDRDNRTIDDIPYTEPPAIEVTPKP